MNDKEHFWKSLSEPLPVVCCRTCKSQSEVGCTHEYACKTYIGCYNYKKAKGMDSDGWNRDTDFPLWEWNGKHVEGIEW